MQTTVPARFDSSGGQKRSPVPWARVRRKLWRRGASVSHSGIVVAVVLVFALVFGHSPAVAQNTSPVVTNVTAQQIEGTGLVRINYDVSDAEGDLVSASVICSVDGGVTFDLLATSVSGDAHRPITPGPGKEIIWDAAADYPGQAWTNVIARVVVSDGPAIAGEMVLVPAGNFTMGEDTSPDASPTHTVYLDAFYIDKYEVTNGEFEAFINAGGYTTRAFWSDQGWATRTSANWTEPFYWSSGEYHSGPGWPGFPVVGISWYEAEAYAKFAGKRLPTEAEWEKAARGTDARTFPWGEGIDGTRANYGGSGDPYDGSSTPVGFYDGRLFVTPPFQTTDSPGPYGTYDQAGNAREWVRDWFLSNYYSSSPPSNPQGPESGDGRVVRGGNFTFGSGALTCFYRQSQYSLPQSRDYTIGFRCARTP